MVYAKLDWYSVMLYNTSFSNILEKLEISLDITDELLNSAYERSSGYSSEMAFSYYGITLEVNLDDYLSTEQDKLLTSIFSKVRLDISGRGLDYLRSRELPVDTLFTQEDFWGDESSFKVTRSDFAFDFVNYKPEFLDNLFAYLIRKTGTTDRLLVGRRSGINFSFRLGDQKTCYLGSTRGDKMLRIYDKLMEQRPKGVWKNGTPPAAFVDEGIINSWFRIEFQTRRKCADTFLFGIDHDLSRVLRVLFTDYLIREEGKPLDFMLDFYRWEDLPPIIQNAKCAPSVSVIERSENMITRQAFKSIVSYISLYGVKGFVRRLNDELQHTFTSNSSVMSYRAIALNLSLVSIAADFDTTVLKLPGLTITADGYRINPDS